MFKKSVLLIFLTPLCALAQGKPSNTSLEITATLLERVSSQNDLQTQSLLQSVLNPEVNRREILGRDGKLTSFSLSTKTIYSLSCKRSFLERALNKNKKTLRQCQIAYSSTFCGADRFANQAQSFRGHTFAGLISFSAYETENGLEIVNHQVTNDRSRISMKAPLIQTHQDRNIDSLVEPCEIYMQEIIK